MPSPRDLRRWRQYLADERAEADIYSRLAERKEGEEREILLSLAEAEGRHEQHWRRLLGDEVGRVRKPDVRTRILGFLASRFGSVFVLALMQRAEGRSPYEADPAATEQMAADERVHQEVVRGLASRGRAQLAGTFRAAVFGANDGLVSNLALIMGVGASGVAPHIILLTGISGLLAGALSMGAGEFVSVRSQRELLGASTPDESAHDSFPHLDVNANELALVYRARGMSEADAESRAQRVLTTHTSSIEQPDGCLVVHEHDDHEEVGSAWGAALSSFCFFASGAVIPILPYLFGLTGWVAVALSALLVGVALMLTGAAVGLLSGVSPLSRGLRQLFIGYGAAAVTYLLGLVFGTSVS